MISRVRKLAACGEPKKRPVAPIETFARSWLAATSSIFMDFHGFHEISWISRVGCRAACGGLCCRGPSPIETFARCQFAAIAAISSIFMEFIDFHAISWDVMRFHGFHEIS